jgi:chemotaxis protein MotB
VASRRRRHDAHDEEHESHERWLISYADMITLLFVLFVVLFAIGQTDAAKYSKLKSGLSDAFGNSQVLADGNGLLAGAPRVAPTMTEPPVPVSEQARTALAEKQAHDAAVRREAEALDHARDEILASLAARGLADTVELHSESRGLVVTIVTDRVLFDSGSAELRSDGRAVLDALAPSLVTLPNRIAIEGHTDDRPIASAVFPSNWELSTARASSVLRYLVNTYGFSASKLAAAGYADQRPLAENDSDANRAHNRRVELVVLSTIEDGN